MIILIGGVSHTGKTYLAQKLLEAHKIPYLSLDHLKMGLLRGGVPCGFSSEDQDHKIAIAMWPVVEGIIRTNIENKQHLTIEGCYLPPSAVRTLKEEFSSEIIECFLTFTENYIRNNFQSEILKNRDVIEKRKYPENRTLEEFLLEHQSIRSLCKKEKLNHVDIDENFESSIQECLKFLNKEIIIRSQKI